MRLSVVIVNWNSRDDLQACLTSLHAQTHPDLEVIVVDNGSTDGSAEVVASDFPRCVLLRQDENVGFAEGCNRGIDAATGPWIALLNNDTVVDPEWARALAGAAEREPAPCGMLQSLLLFMDRRDTINSTGIELTRHATGRDRDEGRPRTAAQAREAQDVFCPTAGAAAYRRAMLDVIRLSTGYFDRDHFMYLEDLDLGWRARLAGWTARFVPNAVVYHKWHGSSGRRGRSWLIVLARTNRIRSLLKNASPSFMARTSPRTAIAIGELLWHGGGRAVRNLAAAVRAARARRREVTAMARVDRRDLERRWIDASE